LKTINHKLRVLFFDIETAPSLGYLWRANQKWIAPTQTVHEFFILTWAAKWEGSDKVLSARMTSTEAIEQDDSRIVTKLADLMRKADVVVGHNVDRFDTVRVNSRLMILGLEPLGPVASIDTLKLVKASFGLMHRRLDWIAQQLGVGEKRKTDFALWKEAYAGDVTALKDMDEYCQWDVELLEKVYNRMKPYVKKLRRLYDARFEEQPICPNCGAEGDDNFKIKKYYRTNAGTFPQFQCFSCLRYHRGRKSVKRYRSKFVPL